MITVEQATEIVLAHTIDIPTKEVSLENANQKILQEDLLADRDFPPFDRVTMDGIGISFARWKEGQRTFSIEDIQVAGSPQKTLQNAQSCMEVMTGAMLPTGIDTVIRYEDIEINKNENSATISADLEIKEQQNVHFQGLDTRKGSLILSKGIILSPAEIAIAATIGKSKLIVSALPKVAIISTGDELVNIDEIPLPHQIRKSNSYALLSALKEDGIEASLFHLADDPVEIEKELKDIFEKFEIVILSGGVSKGKLDFIPTTLEKLGVKKLFHKVAQRPGKPFWFGVRKNAQKQNTVFAFPGNPVSTFMCFYRYFKPWLRKSIGFQPFPNNKATLSKDIQFKPQLRYFAQVKLGIDNDGKRLATPIEGHGSGDFANLSECDAFLELPSHKNQFLAGEIYPFILYRNQW